jgi:L,D-peptidoglycan transpeptidase YkuD (ErfK/YbiS/YcfS/YnhG family)
MSWGRVMGVGATVVAVAAGIALAVGVSHAATESDAARPLPSVTAPPSIPAQLPGSTGTSGGDRARPVLPTTASSAARSTTSAPRSSAHPPSSQHPSSPAGATSVDRTQARSTPTHSTSPAATHSAAPKPSSPAPHLVKGTALPLHEATGTATRVITVVARSTHSTTATLQAWTKAPGGGWLRHGAAVTAHVGSDGLTTQPSESKSATPIGSFTLTRAFGHDADPGTPLPYTHTTPSYWWISQPGKLYNTMQHCASNCAFTRGNPNEHLYYETPFYNYAVVIDYNTRNAGPVRQGAGSAFFLHVTDGHATAGCVAIPQSKLISIMKWLSPAAHPRILIGVT